MTKMLITVYFCDQNRVCYFKIVTIKFVHSRFNLFYFISYLHACYTIFDRWALQYYIIIILYRILCTAITKWTISMWLESGGGQNQVYPITLKLQKVTNSLAFSESCHV